MFVISQKIQTRKDLQVSLTLHTTAVEMQFSCIIKHCILVLNVFAPQTGLLFTELNLIFVLPFFCKSISHTYTYIGTYLPVGFLYSL